MAHDKKHPRTILELHPGQLMELDGAVLDLDSYDKHRSPSPCTPKEAGSPADRSYHGQAADPEEQSADSDFTKVGSFVSSSSYFSGSAPGSYFAGGYGLELI